MPGPALATFAADLHDRLDGGTVVVVSEFEHRLGNPAVDRVFPDFTPRPLGFT